MNAQLERLKRFADLRTIWQSEDGDFTPWLAENLELLGETLGVELELEAMEKTVGPFRADILCRETGRDGGMVLVENQLEATDHTHLGQLLTYAAGLEAVTIVWIAAPIRDEHRAALDWLNKVTDESCHFFGLEIELWRIGNSAPAPRFNIVSKPNDWSRSVSQATRSISEEDLSETQRMQVAYWSDFHDVLKRDTGPVSGNRKPQRQSWMTYAVGHGGFSVGAAFNTQKNHVRVWLDIHKGRKSKAFLDLLKREEDTIEKELNIDSDLHWTSTEKEAKIMTLLEDVNPKKKSDWPHQHEWLAISLNKMHTVFAPRVKKLDLNDWEPAT